jgi:hypothetical protein
MDEIEGLLLEALEAWRSRTSRTRDAMARRALWRVVDAAGLLATHADWDEALTGVAPTGRGFKVVDVVPQVAGDEGEAS